MVESSRLTKSNELFFFCEFLVAVSKMFVASKWRLITLSEILVLTTKRYIVKRDFL